MYEVVQWRESFKTFRDYFYFYYPFQKIRSQQQVAGQFQNCVPFVRINTNCRQSWPFNHLMRLRALTYIVMLPDYTTPPNESLLRLEKIRRGPQDRYFFEA